MSESKSCLIVDDSMVARMIIIDFLQKLHGDWQVYQASNGQEAFEILQNNDIDFMSVDYNMPIMTGIELLAKRKSHFPKTKCVLLTANVQEHTSLEADSLEVKCLHKPINEAVVNDMAEYFNE